MLKDARRHAERTRLIFRGLAALTLISALGAAASSGLAAGLVLAAAGSLALYNLSGPLTSLGFTRTVNPVYGLQGIAASGTATLNIPVGRRYHSLRILTTNTAGALTDPTTIASNVKLIVNGVTMLDASPAQCINLAKTFRITPGTGEIPIFFSEPWRNDTRTAEATSWDMFGQGSFVLQITFLNPGGGVGVQAVLADFDGLRNETVNAQGQRVPFLAIIKRFNIAVNSPSGESDITNIPTNYPIQRIFFDVSANAFTAATVYADNNYKVLEATKIQNQDMLNANLITGTFFEYPIVFDYDSKLTSNLRTSALDIKVTTSGACTTTAHVCQLVPGYV